MNNGQMNMVSMQAMTPLNTLGQAVPAVVATAGEQQDSGGFAGLLNGIQTRAKVKTALDPGQAEQSLVVVGKELLVPEASAEEQVVNLLMRQVTAPAEAAAPKQEEAEKVSADDVTLCSESSDVAAQIAMAACVQTGRMPDVNKPTPLPVDGTHEVASVTAQPAVAPMQVPQAMSASLKDTVPVSDRMSEVNKPAVSVTAQPAVEPLQVPPAKPAPMKETMPALDGMSEVNKPASLPVDRSQKVAAQQVNTSGQEEVAKESASASSSQPAAAVAQPAVISASEVLKQPVQAIAEPIVGPQAIAPIRQESAKENAAASQPQPEASDRMSDASKSVPVTADRPQNAAIVTNQPALSNPPGSIQEDHVTAESAQTIPVENPATSSSSLQPELPSARQAAPRPVLSPESEVEMQLSQPRPIIARVATESAAGNRSSGLIQETRGVKQRVSSEQQIEKVRTGDEQNVVKELASALRPAASDGESTLGSDTPQSDSGNQGQPDSASDNQMMVQNMRGQSSSEHQKVSAFSAKAVPAEPVRQDIPEQVMHQVKERLVQHDVKPGSQQITLTLSPDSLGELKMNLNLQGQKLSVEIVAENRAVRDAIVQHTDTLKESLARQNITMESFDVTTGGKGSGSQAQNQNAWRELAKQQQQQQFWTVPRGNNYVQADLPSDQAAYLRQQGQSMLDIHY
ncbi:MAG: flagellar hook-length control protein FliK [Pelobacteraceae bacterium]